MLIAPTKQWVGRKGFASFASQPPELMNAEVNQWTAASLSLTPYHYEHRIT